MSGTINKVMLIGHTGDDVKVKYFEDGGAIGRFNIATNETYRNRTTGERVTNTEWHTCVARNKAAEVLEKYLKKGDKVYIEGRLKTRKWQDETGRDRYNTEVHVNEFTFLSAKGDSNQQGQQGGYSSPAQQQTAPAQQQYAPQPAAPQQPATPAVDDNDDLPF